MGITSIIAHQPNSFYVELRDDYIRICDMHCTYRKKNSKSATRCKALLLSVLEHWTNSKRDKGAPLWVTMTTEQWISQIYEEYKHNAIIDSLEELERNGFIKRQQMKNPNGGKPIYRYLLNYQFINKLIKDLPEITLDEVSEFNTSMIPPRMRVQATSMLNNNASKVDSSTLETTSVTIQPSKVEKSTLQGGKINLAMLKNHHYITYYTTSNTTSNIDSNYLGSEDAAASHQQDQDFFQKETSIQDSLFEETPPSEKKSRRNKKATALEVKAPELPDLTASATVENIMLLGDFHRGCSIPESTRPNSAYVKVCGQGARPLALKKRAGGKQGYTLSEIHACWNFLTGITPEDKPWLKDEEWMKHGFPVDLHVIAKNIDNKLAMMEELERKHRKIEEKKPDAPQTPKPEKLVLWTRQDDEWVATILKTRRDHVEEWENCRDHILWEYMTADEAEALNNGWKKYYTFSDRETRELFAAQKKRLKEQESVLVS